MFKLKNDQWATRLKSCTKSLWYGTTIPTLVLGVCILGLIYVVIAIGHAFLNPTPTRLSDFPVPDNVCVINGQPQVITVDTRTMSQQYLRDDGTIVTRFYDTNLDGSLYVSDEAIGTGGICGSTTR